VVPAIDRASWPEVVALATSPHVLPALGLHPEAPGDLDGLEEALRSAGAVAVGEIGLDRRLPNWDRQLEMFREQLALGQRLGLPVLVHCVRAHDVLPAELRDASLSVPVVLHAYSGSADLVPVYEQLGCYFSFAGAVTWAGSRRGPRACAAVPEDRIVLETDAPYLAPHPFRGQPSQPSWIAHVASAVAQIRGVTVERLSATTTANAERAFCV
jgi:TatD DNase family protein